MLAGAADTEHLCRTSLDSSLASSIRSCVTLGKSLNPFELIFSFEENEVRITAPASWNCGEE